MKNKISVAALITIITLCSTSALADSKQTDPRIAVQADQTFSQYIYALFGWNK